jgi:hypothetical protein
VVSSKNLLAAAATEGAALLVERTQDAEAEAAYKTIGAEAEKKAAALRGEGLTLFRRNVAGHAQGKVVFMDSGAGSTTGIVRRSWRISSRSLRWPWT